MEWDGCSDAGSDAWCWNWSTWNETQTMQIEDCDEAPPLFPELVLAWFFSQKSGLEARERNMILATTGNRYQLDQVEQAMKIHFPDDEIRHHDDRTGKYHNNILGGAVDEEDDQVTGADEELEIVMRWPQHKKKK